MCKSRQSEGRVGSRRDAGRVGATPTWLALVSVIGGTALAACSATVGSTDQPGGPDGGQTASGGGAGRVTTTGAGGNGAPGGNGVPPGGTGGTAPTVLDCSAISPGRAPLRRLTTYEYNATIRDL